VSLGSNIFGPSLLPGTLQNKLQNGHGFKSQLKIIFFIFLSSAANKAAEQAAKKQEQQQQQQRLTTAY
jgi:hypothetical protein